MLSRDSLFIEFILWLAMLLEYFDKDFAKRSGSTCGLKASSSSSSLLSWFIFDSESKNLLIDKVEDFLGFNSSLGLNIYSS